MDTSRVVGAIGEQTEKLGATLVSIDENVESLLTSRTRRSSRARRCRPHHPRGTIVSQTGKDMGQFWMCRDCGMFSSSRNQIRHGGDCCLTVLTMACCSLPTEEAKERIEKGLKLLVMKENEEMAAKQPAYEVD